MKQRRTAHCAPKPYNTGSCDGNPRPSPAHNPPTDDNHAPDDIPGSHDNSSFCPHCFYNPCIAADNEHAHWMGDGAPPSNNNSITRKTLYRTFCATIGNTGGWQNPQYLAKKIAQGGTDTVVFHKREIIPQCVLNLCRQKYPNPKDKPYTGCQWS